MAGLLPPPDIRAEYAMPPSGHFALFRYSNDLSMMDLFTGTPAFWQARRAWTWVTVTEPSSAWPDGV